MPRRHFLGLGLMALSGVVHSRDNEPKSPGWIDAHVHLWPQDTNRYPLANGFDKSGLRAAFEPEALFTECHPLGVTRIVLIQMSFFQFDNRYMLDMMDQHPGVFAGVAIVNENAPNVTNQMRALGRRGVRGFRVYATRENVAAWEQSKPMHAMWKAAADAGQSICCLADPQALPELQRLCRQHPKTSVVIDHFARIGMRGEIHQTDIEALCQMATFENTSVKISAFYALGKKAAPYLDLGDMIKKVRDAFGAERLMWGSDCPFQLDGGHTYADSIKLVRDRLDFLTDAEKQQILRGTAERIFF